MLKTEVEELKKSNRLRNDEANSNSPLMSKSTIKKNLISYSNFIAKISEIMELKKKWDTIGLKSPEEINKKFNEYILK